MLRIFTILSGVFCITWGLFDIPHIADNGVFECVLAIFVGFGLIYAGSQLKTEKRMEWRQIVNFALIVIVIAVGVFFLPEWNDQWQDQLDRSQDPDAASLLRGVNGFSLLLHGEDSSSFNREVRGLSRTISLNCFRFRDPNKCEPAKSELRSIIDHWGQRIDSGTASTR